MRSYVILFFLFVFAGEIFSQPSETIKYLNPGKSRTLQRTPKDGRYNSAIDYYEELHNETLKIRISILNWVSYITNREITQWLTNTFLMPLIPIKKPIRMHFFIKA
jgi:hypothetical protein